MNCELQLEDDSPLREQAQDGPVSVQCLLCGDDVDHGTAWAMLEHLNRSHLTVGEQYRD